MATLFINIWDSRCGSCGKGADPYATAHDERLGNDITEGCHEPFTEVSSDYFGDAMQERIEEMRPDLPWVDIFKVDRSIGGWG